MSRIADFARCLALAPLAACVTEASPTSQVDQDIVGGQLAQITDFPTTVALEHAPGDWTCTGTLIDKDWVLTAAHCVLAGEGEPAETIATLKIRFDDNNINNATGGREVAVTEIHANPGYDGDAWDNDIAVVKLAESITDRPATPVHRGAVAFGTSIIEVGYGSITSSGNDGGGVLYKLTTATADCALANTASPGQGISNANLLCFDGTDGNASCYGDSGGPAFVTVDGKYEVAGVTSGGTADACTGPKVWDLYTSVNAEIAFVDMYVPVVGATDPTDPTDPTGSGSDGSGSGSDGTGGDGTGNPKSGGDGGGCAVGGGSGGAGLALALGAVAIRRRRRG